MLQNRIFFDFHEVRNEALEKAREEKLKAIQQAQEEQMIEVSRELKQVTNLKFESNFDVNMSTMIEILMSKD